MLTFNCLLCNKEYKPTKKDQKFCSKECGYEQQIINTLKAQANKTLPTIICAFCNNKFSCGDTTRKTCSIECRTKLIKERKRANFKPKEPKILTCKGCGKEFIKERNKNKRYYCNPSCNKAERNELLIVRWMDRSRAADKNLNKAYLKITRSKNAVKVPFLQKIYTVVKISSFQETNK